MVAEDSIKKDTSGVFRCHAVGDSCKMNHLAETVNKHNDACVVLFIWRVAKDEIHADGLPIILWNRKRVERSLSRRRRLHALAHIASANVLAHPFVLVRPVEVAGKREKSLFTTKVASLRWGCRGLRKEYECAAPRQEERRREVGPKDPLRSKASRRAVNSDGVATRDATEER